MITLYLQQSLQKVRYLWIGFCLLCPLNALAAAEVKDPYPLFLVQIGWTVDFHVIVSGKMSFAEIALEAKKSPVSYPDTVHSIDLSLWNGDHTSKTQGLTITGYNIGDASHYSGLSENSKLTAFWEHDEAKKDNIIHATNLDTLAPLFTTKNNTGNDIEIKKVILDKDTVYTGEEIKSWIDNPSSAERGKFPELFVHDPLDVSSSFPSWGYLLIGGSMIALLSTALIYNQEEKDAAKATSSQGVRSRKKSMPREDIKQ